MLDFLTAPNLPRVSLSISETDLAMIELRSRGKGLEPRHVGVMGLPANLVRVSFTEPNVTSETTFIDYLTRTAEQAGLSRVRKLMVALPENSARSFIASLDSVSSSRAEMNQMIEWKAERNLGCKPTDLHLAHRRLETLAGKSNFLVSAIHKRVLEQYEKIFAEMGWQAGVVMPQHLGEAQWLMRQALPEDQAMVSVNPHGFTVVLVRGREPILVREIVCAPAERDDEFYRLMIYYRDRLQGGSGTLNRLLVIGAPEEQNGFRRTLEAALERHSVALTPDSLGLNLEPGAPFNRIAAAAGLATLGC
jgi:Tfp pilus assembly PilM family ATPase